MRLIDGSERLIIGAAFGEGWSWSRYLVGRKQDAQLRMLAIKSSIAVLSPRFLRCAFLRGRIDMLIVFDDRLSESPFVERIWRSHSEQAGTFYSIAACHWEMVVTRHEGRTSLTIRGPETRATTAGCPAYGEWIAIRFRLGTFMRMLRPGCLRDHKSVTLPAASRRSFFLNGSAWEYPDFDNAETFVNRLARDGLISADDSVLDTLRNQPHEQSLRTSQRHVLEATGLTYSAIRQIERARRATNLLKEGVSILDAVSIAGYYDQAHLTRSLKRFVGQTPAQILRAEQQLSFLYKTGPT